MTLFFSLFFHLLQFYPFGFDLLNPAAAAPAAPVDPHAAAAPAAPASPAAPVAPAASVKLAASVPVRMMNLIFLAT